MSNSSACLDCVERSPERRGLCKRCVKRRLRAGRELPPLQPRTPKPPRRCSVDDCKRRQVARGRCHAHWKELRRSELETELWNSDGPLQQHFWTLVEVGHPAGCWWWTGAKNDKGYARATVGGRTRGAHRWAYEFLVGEIGTDPDSGKPLDLDHLCKNRLCVNPDHMEPVTHQVNIWRSSRYAGHDECFHGHPRTPENSGFDINGHLFCIPCRKGWHERNYDEWRQVRRHELAAIRSWGRENGYQVKAVGPLPRVLLDAYAVAHSATPAA